MRITDWTPERKPQPQALVDAILARRGGTLLNLDKALLWSEPVARGWNVYLKAVRTELPTSRKLRELGICTVALLTGAHYEYHHHAPDFLAAGGTQLELDALQGLLTADPHGAALAPGLGELEALVNGVTPRVVKFGDVQAAMVSLGLRPVVPVEPTTGNAA